MGIHFFLSDLKKIQWVGREFWKVEK
jgi:hypothetical protein